MKEPVLSKLVKVIEILIAMVSDVQSFQQVNYIKKIYGKLFIKNIK